MKHSILICAIAGLLASCSKDYTCVCTYTSTSSGTTHTYADTYKANSSKSNADAWCASLQSPKVEVNGTSQAANPTTCQIQ
jgi:hypothetical protein